MSEKPTCDPMDNPRFAKWIVVVPSGCWIWCGSRDRFGYGRFHHQERKVWRAHRAAWFMKHGNIDPALTVDHLCRERACVNPAHMELVSQRVNNLRGDSWAGRKHRQTHCHRGHPLVGENLIMEKRSRRCRRCTHVN